MWLAAMLDRDPPLATDRPGLLLIADNGFASRRFESHLAMRGITLLRPSFEREKTRAGEPLPESVRQLIESVKGADRYRNESRVRRSPRRLSLTRVR